MFLKKKTFVLKQAYISNWVE